MSVLLRRSTLARNSIPPWRRSFSTAKRSVVFVSLKTSSQISLSQIVAIGRNYVAHIKELSNTAPKEPFFFLKPTSSYVQSGGQIEIPKGVIVHHEGPYQDFLLCARESFTDAYSVEEL